MILHTLNKRWIYFLFEDTCGSYLDYCFYIRDAELAKTYVRKKFILKNWDVKSIRNFKDIVSTV